MEEASRAIEALRELGLSEYESRAYAALLAMGDMTPREVSSATRIPYTKVYEVLRRLESKGWVRRLSTRPLTYAARRPGEVMARIRASLEERLKRAEEALRRLEEMGVGSVAPAGVYLVRRLESLKRIVRGLMIEARREVLALLSTEEFAEAMSQAPRRPRKVKCLVRAGLRPPRGCEHRPVQLLFPLDILISDRERMVLSLSPLRAGREPSVCGVVVLDRVVAETASDYLEKLWEAASKPQ